MHGYIRASHNECYCYVFVWGWPSLFIGVTTRRGLHQFKDSDSSPDLVELLSQTVVILWKFIYMDLSLPTMMWSLGSLVGVRSWTAYVSVVGIIFWCSVGWAWTWSTAVLRMVTRWAVVCGWSVVWSVCCVTVGSVTVALVCWMGLPWAASIATVPIPLMWSGVAFVQVTMAGAWCLLYLECDLDLSLLSQSSQICLELDLVWQFLCTL